MVYLTTQPKHELPTHVSIHSLNRESIAICEQITSVAKERIGTYRGHVTDEEMQGIESAIMISLGITASKCKNSQSELEQDVDTSVLDKLSNTSTRLSETETKLAVLQEMYDSLLNKLMRG